MERHLSTEETKAILWLDEMYRAKTKSIGWEDLQKFCEANAIDFDNMRSRLRALGCSGSHSSGGFLIQDDVIDLARQIRAQQNALPDHVEGFSQWARQNRTIAVGIVILAALTAISALFNNIIDIVQKLKR